MAENSKIGWTDHSWNPWVGCQRVSQGCVHCYAETLLTQRQGRDVWGAKDKRQRTGEGIWRKPARWNREAAERRRPFRVFCSSLADVFEDAPGPNEWRPDVWEIVRATPWLDWQLLTKRPENIARMLPDDWGRGYPNVWLGTSIEDRNVVERARVLAAVPAFRRFISAEPLIGPLVHDGYIDDDVAGGYSLWADRFRGPQLDLSEIDWLIIGGESGPGHRPMDLDWARDLHSAARGPNGRRCSRCGGDGGEPGSSCELCSRCHGYARDSVSFFFKQTAGARPGQGADALGEVLHGFPASWDRADVDTHPVFAAEGSMLR